MPGLPALWSPIIGSLFTAPNGAERVLTSDDKTILAHMYQSPWDAEFHLAAPITLAASAVRQTVVEFSPGVARLGIIRAIAMGVAVLADYDNIRWAVTVDDTPYLGFDNIRGPFGVFVYPKPLTIPLYSDHVAKIVASNLTAVAIPLVTAYFMGTHFPRDVDAR